MQKFRRRFGSIYSDEEARVLGPWQRIRQAFLAPFARLLSRAGISPDMLSYLSVVFSIAFCLLAPVDYRLAFWLLVVAIILDGLDGVEARALGNNTPRGSFTDLVCDIAVTAFSVAGIAWYGSVQVVLAILYVYIYTALGTFLLLHHLLEVSSRWIIRPSRMLLYAAIALEYFFHINVLNYLLLLYLFTLPCLALSFWRLRKAF
jgi:phosphatidylglycerophosphate synthase